MEAEAAEKPQVDKNNANRRHPRKVFLRDAGILYEGFYVIEKCADISESGISFFSTREIPIGSHAVLTFQIPGGTLISVKAVVMGHFISPDGRVRTGCAYKNIRFEFKREIRNYVSAR